MMRSDVDVIVVGAGLAGLAAARHLHQGGRTVQVFEAADEPGGRIRTDVVDDYRLDRGFQVLLPAYPELRRVVDIPALRLRPFVRGAIAVPPQGRSTLAPPWHGRDAITGTAGFAARSPRDAAVLAAMSAQDVALPDSLLHKHLPAGSIEEDLRRRRVSERTLDGVLRPFLAGVFLDPQLATSAQLFHLIWRSFLRGGGALPAAGMQELPRQMTAMLPAGTIQTGVEVIEVSGSHVTLAGGERSGAKAVVVATDGTTAARLLPEITAPAWHSVTTWYFTAPIGPSPEPILLLDGASDLLINTTVLSAVAPDYAPPGSALIAASVPGHVADTDIEAEVRARLSHLYDCSTSDWTTIARYPIPQALPVFPPGQSMRQPVRVGPGRYVCGDHRDTSSIQGALISGRRAATAVLRDFSSR